MLGTTGDDQTFDLHPVSKRCLLESKQCAIGLDRVIFWRMNDVKGALTMMLRFSRVKVYRWSHSRQNVTLVQRANPITYITEEDLKFSICMDLNRLVPLSQSQLLDAALRKAGVQTELHVVVDGIMAFGEHESR